MFVSLKLLPYGPEQNCCSVDSQINYFFPEVSSGSAKPFISRQKALRKPRSYRSALPKCGELLPYWPGSSGPLVERDYLS